MNWIKASALWNMKPGSPRVMEGACSYDPKLMTIGRRTKHQTATGQWLEKVASWSLMNNIWYPAIDVLLIWLYCSRTSRTFSYPSDYMHLSICLCLCLFNHISCFVCQSISLCFGFYLCTCYSTPNWVSQYVDWSICLSHFLSRATRLYDPLHRSNSSTIFLPVHPGINIGLGARNFSLPCLSMRQK